MEDKKSPIKYCVSDAWLLASIEFSSGKRWAGIRDIIAAGDYMNHATFLEKEFEEGLYRLSKGRWIRRSGDKFKVSKRFKDQKLDYSSGRGYSPRKLFRLVMDLLCVKLSDRQGKPTGVKYPRFTSDKFLKAKKEYFKSHEK